MVAGSWETPPSSGVGLDTPALGISQEITPTEVREEVKTCKYMNTKVKRELVDVKFDLAWTSIYVKSISWKSHFKLDPFSCRCLIYGRFLFQVLEAHVRSQKITPWERNGHHFQTKISRLFEEDEDFKVSIQLSY